MVQRYVNVPAVENCREYDAFAPLSPDVVPSVNVTLWVMASGDHVHVTVVPTGTVMADGVKKSLLTVTAFAAVGVCPPPVLPPGVPPPAVAPGVGLVESDPPHAATTSKADRAAVYNRARIFDDSRR